MKTIFLLLLFVQQISAQTSYDTKQDTRLTALETAVKALQNHKTLIVGGTVKTGVTTDTLTINFPPTDYKPAFDSTGKVAKIAATTSSALLGYKRQSDTVKLRVDTLQSYNVIVKQTLLDYLKAFDDLNNAILIKADESDLNDAKGRLGAIESKLFKMLQALQ